MNTFTRRAPMTGLVALALALSGCNSTPADNSATESRLQALDAKFVALQGRVEALQKNIADDKQRQDLDKLFVNVEKVGYLTPGTDGYAVVRYDLGALTVQLADVEPYANGSRVILRFGNTLAATVNGLKLSIDWGTVTNQGPDNLHQKSKEMTFSEQLRSGAWTSVPVVLEGVPPAELGFVRVHDITHTGIVLSR
jgi:hypothetical protein